MWRGEVDVALLSGCRTRASRVELSAAPRRQRHGAGKTSEGASSPARYVRTEERRWVPAQQPVLDDSAVVAKAVEPAADAGAFSMHRKVHVAPAREDHHQRLGAPRALLSWKQEWRQPRISGLQKFPARQLLWKDAEGARRRLVEGDLIMRRVAWPERDGGAAGALDLWAAGRSLLPDVLRHSFSHQNIELLDMKECSSYVS